MCIKHADPRKSANGLNKVGIFGGNRDISNILRRRLFFESKIYS